MRTPSPVVSPLALILLTTLWQAACSGAREAAAPAAPEPAPPPAAAPAAPPAPPATARSQPADPNEACGRILVVAYKGAAHAPDAITRDKAAAGARALELLDQIKAGAELAVLARTESDAPSSAARDGIMGTFKKPDWPELHTAIRDPLFALDVGALAPAPIEADYGYVLLQRCPVEKARSRHILVRYKGSKRSEPGIKRSKEAAQARAAELLEKLEAGADFAALAKTDSDDSSKGRGGDIGLQGRGLLAPAYERALFALQPGQRSPLIETEFGFHIIERLPEPSP